MEDDQLIKFKCHGKKPKIAGRMEEAIILEEENNFKLEKIFFIHFP